MRILFILENFYPHIGGVETLFAGLGRELARQGHRVQVLTRKQKGLKPEEKWEGIDIRRIGVTGRSLFGIQAVPLATRLGGEADLIQTSLYSAAVAGALAGRYAKKPVVVTAHEVWDELWYEMPFLGPLEKEFYRRAEKRALQMDFLRYVAVSSFTEKRLRERVERPWDVRLIYNGIDYDQFSPSTTKREDGPFRFTYFGRLGVSKGIDILARAVRIWYNKEEKNSAVFELIVPRRPKRLYKWLLSYARGNDLGAICTFRHELPEDELRKRLRASDCVLIPSYSEGFCFAAAEAVALEIPVIHSGRGALPEVVGGRSIEMQELDSMALYDAMKQAVAGNFEESDRPRFPLDDCVNAYISLYKEIVS